MRCRCRSCLFMSSGACASCFMIRLCSDIRPCVNTGVAGIRSTSFWQQVSAFTSTTLGTLKWTTVFGMLPSTLSGSNGNSPLAAKPAMTFFGVKASYLAESKREVMSIQACRDARCAGTLVLSDARHAHNTPVNRESQRASTLWLPAFYLIRRRQRELQR
jgi:hypothetical protein